MSTSHSDRLAVSLSLPAAIALLAGSGLAPAQTIYKSVDADGVVTYSASPPRDVAVDRAETLSVDPPPPEADRAAAEQRLLSAQQGVAGSKRAPAQRAGADDAASLQPDSAAPIPGQAPAQAVDEQIERARSSSRITRPTGVGRGQDRVRSGGQLPSGRTSR